MHAKRPIPWRPVVVIGLSNSSHFFGMCSLFSYAGLLCVEMGWASSTESSGLVAGWLATSVFFGRLFTASPWGLFADRYGRRFALLITLASHALGNLAFGLSTSFWAAVVSRIVLLGALNGYTTLLGILVYEVAGPENQNQVMAYALGFGGATQLVGPAIGGYLYMAIPAFPALASSLVGTGIALITFSLAWFWLPETSMAGSFARKVSAVATTTSAAEAAAAPAKEEGEKASYSPVMRNLSKDVVKEVVNFGLGGASKYEREGAVREFGIKAWGSKYKVVATCPDDIERDEECNFEYSNGGIFHGSSLETRPENRPTDCHGSCAALGNDDGDDKKEEEEEEETQSIGAAANDFSAWSVLTRLPLLRRVMILRMLVGFLFFSLVEVVPLWVITDPAVGGLGDSQVDVGHIMTAAACVNLCFTLFIMSPCMNRFGQRISLLFTGLFACAGFLLLCFVRRESRDDISPRLHGSVTLTAGESIFSRDKIFAAGAFSVVFMACMVGTTAVVGLTNTVAPPIHRGLANGIAVTVEGVGKGVAPAVTGSVFAGCVLQWGNTGHILVIVLLAALAASVAGLAFTLPSGLDADQHASPTQEEDEPKDIEAEGKGRCR